jgi:hypothetical protein
MVAVAYAALLVGALAVTAARGNSVLATVAGIAALVILVINRGYESLYDTRYLAPLLPMAYAAVGMAAAPYLSQDSPRRRLAVAALAVAAIYPLVSLGVFYRQERAAGRTNRPLIIAVDRLASSTRYTLALEGEPIGSYTFVDKAMRPIKHGGGGDPTRTYSQLLTMHGVDHQLTDTDELRWFFTNDRETRYWVVAAESTARALGAEFELHEWESGDGWVVLERRP